MEERNITNMNILARRLGSTDQRIRSHTSFAANMVILSAKLHAC